MHNLVRFVGEIRKYGRLMAIIATLTVINSALTLPPPMILKYLTDHLTQPVFACRLRWEPDMLALWDNRLCVHQAYNDYQGYRRELYHTTVRGEKPA